MLIRIKNNKRADLFNYLAFMLFDNPELRKESNLVSAVNVITCGLSSWGPNKYGTSIIELQRYEWNALQCVIDMKQFID